MKKCILLFVFFVYLLNTAMTQSVTASPVVGAVTAHSAKLLFFTDCICNGELQVSTNPDFSYVLSFPFETTVNRSATVELQQLTSATPYYYQILLNDKIQIQKGSFKTFPAEHQPVNFSFTLGSCTEQHHDDSIFITMQQHHPAFFLHLGDWLYTNNFNENPFYYVQSIEHQKELYQKRYDMPNLKMVFGSTPVDFVFDDEDGVYDDFSATSFTSVKVDGKNTDINEIQFPDSLRNILIEGWHTFFPGYHQNENQAYHSFVYGQTEFFFLDTRSTRTPNSENFRLKKNGKWKYKVPKGHVILDTTQMEWLLHGLQHSKADWKFIVSGVTFNQSYKKVLDICMRAQKQILPNGMTGAYVAAAMSSMWFAFPESQIQLLNFCHDKQIKNVIVLSGDAHTAAIDDGKNAGFPELMAGGLAQNNSKLASIIKNDLHLNLWNQGGQGIGNDNYNDAFGKVEVLKDSTVKLSCIDKNNTEICSSIVQDGFIPQTYKLKPLLKIKRLRALRNLLRIAIHKR